jgi:anti-sigma28 factor (negative regulator of flagellin synthesis)
MKIQQNGQGNQVDQSQAAKQTARTDTASQQTGSNARQVGLDRIELSHVAETASRVLAHSGAARGQKVAALEQVYQAGQYSVNPKQLSEAIINHDLETDTSQGSGRKS